MWYRLNCLSVEDGAFSGERVCCVRAYEDESLRTIEVDVPKGRVSDGGIRLSAERVDDYHARVLMPIAGCGDFETFVVPSEDLVRI